MPFTQQSRFWPAIALLMTIVAVCLLIALIAIVAKEDDADSGPSTCGTQSSNENDIDTSEPSKPGPFHDLTSAEINAIRTFLEDDPNITAVRVGVEGEEVPTANYSYIITMDLQPPAKADALKFLDANGPQPTRQARVMLYRVFPPQDVVLEERVCGPLPSISACDLLVSSARRNPVELSLRPLSSVEFMGITLSLLPKIDDKLGFLLRESFGAVFIACQDQDLACLEYTVAPAGTALYGDINKRRMWIQAAYKVEDYSLHPLDFAVLLVLEGQDPGAYFVDKVWYNGVMYGSMDKLVVAYNSNGFVKLKKTVPIGDQNLFSSLHLRGEYFPKQSLRPPTLVEPDGKRFSLKNRQVDYMGWSFNFHMSTFQGPALFDVNFKGERIAYEIALNEIAVFYSGDTPFMKVLDMVDSNTLLGIYSKALIPGADCPDNAVFVSTTIPGQLIREPIVYKNSFCLFEHNGGIPLRRHLQYSEFYGGMLDSYLTLRSILTIGNYDYIIDFMFHQDGVLDTRIASTGYILTSPFREPGSPYGFHINQGIIGNIHHHMFHFKVDLDVSGTSNRYETLDISVEEAVLETVPGRQYHQIKYTPTLKRTEQDALYKFNFDAPKYHIVYSNSSTNALGEKKAYRLITNGMSKQLLPEGIDNEVSIPWARHQMVVTKHKDDEQVSTSPYALWDSENPVTDFSKFYEDDENIVDEDLVFWVSMGVHHIPHSEDLPLTATTGTKLSFSIAPYNYFPQCPSMGSRDAVRVAHKSSSKPSLGVNYRTYLSHKDTCALPKSTFKDLLSSDPDVALETNRQTLMI